VVVVVVVGDVVVVDGALVVVVVSPLTVVEDDSGIVVVVEGGGMVVVGGMMLPSLSSPGNSWSRVTGWQLLAGAASMAGEDTTNKPPTRATVIKTPPILPIIVSQATAHGARVELEPVCSTLKGYEPKPDAQNHHPGHTGRACYQRLRFRRRSRTHHNFINHHFDHSTRRRGDRRRK
jgi:hypothetical protein